MVVRGVHLRGEESLEPEAERERATRMRDGLGELLELRPFGSSSPKRLARCVCGDEFRFAWPCAWAPMRRRRVEEPRGVA
eukprot:3867025-Pleurochrysis_carterae.AAC.1